jgi:hypothetical protein
MSLQEISLDLNSISRVQTLDVSQKAKSFTFLITAKKRDKRPAVVPVGYPKKYVYHPCIVVFAVVLLFIWSFKYAFMVGQAFSP